MALALANRSALYARYLFSDKSWHPKMLLSAYNTSALHRQGNTAACLRDTTLALKSGYPKHLRFLVLILSNCDTDDISRKHGCFVRYKLLQRHAKCQTELGNFGEAKAHFKVVTKIVNA